MNEDRKLNEIKHGEKISSNAEKVWGHSKLAGQKRVERRINAMIEMGKLDKNSKILELGCGTGEFTKRLAVIGAELTAIDISPDLLDIAKKNNATFENVILKIGDMETLEGLPDNYYSAIVGNSVLHHVDYEACLKKSFDKLAKGGTIIFTEPNMANPQIALQKNISWLKKAMGDSPDEIAFFRWPLADLLKNIGYNNVKVLNFDFLHPKLPDTIAKTLATPLAVLEKIPVIKEVSGSLLIYAEK